LNAGKTAEPGDYAGCLPERAGTGEDGIVSGGGFDSNTFDFHLRDIFNVTHEFERSLRGRSAVLRFPVCRQERPASEGGPYKPGTRNTHGAEAVE
jgi:hypothetical protein